MSQLFPKSVLLHFPSEMYLRCGVGKLFPLLVRALHEKEIVAFVGVASSPVTWLVSVGGPGASVVLRPPRLFGHRLLSIPIPSLVLFPLRQILFLSLIPFLMIRLHLLQPLFRLTVDDHPRTKHVKRLELVTTEDGDVVMSFGS